MKYFIFLVLLLASIAVYGKSYYCPENAAKAIAVAASTRLYLAKINNREVPNGIAALIVDWDSSSYMVDVVHDGPFEGALIYVIIKHKNCRVIKRGIVGLWGEAERRMRFKYY